MTRIAFRCWAVLALTLCVAAAGSGCNHGGDDVVVSQEYSLSARQECRQMPGVDWSVLEEKVDRAMFDVCTIRVNGSQVRLLGFRPFIVSTYQVTGSSTETQFVEVELVTVAAAARKDLWLYLINTRQGLYMAKWFTDQPAGDGAWLHPEEVVYAFRRQDRRLPFELVREDKIYVDMPFYNMMLNHGLCRNGELLPVPDPTSTEQPVEAGAILQVPGEQQQPAQPAPSQQP